MNMINISPVLSTFWESLLEIRETLIMLIFCPCSRIDPPPPPQSPQKINMIYMIYIFPVLDVFWKRRISMINMINISLF